MNKKSMLKIISNKNRTLNVRELLLCLSLQQNKQKQCLKVERWLTMKRIKCKTEHQVKEVKISTILYSINQLPKLKIFPKQQ